MGSVATNQQIVPAISVDGGAAKEWSCREVLYGGLEGTVAMRPRAADRAMQRFSGVPMPGGGVRSSILGLPARSIFHAHAEEAAGERRRP